MRRMLNKGRDRLAEYCKRSRLKQYELADLLAMHETTLSHVLSGKRRPGLDTALRIEAVTGIPVSSWSDTRVAGMEPQPRARRIAAVGREKSRAIAS